MLASVLQSNIREETRYLGFVGLFPPEDVSRAIWLLGKGLGLEEGLTAPHRAHMTIFPFGAWPEYPPESILQRARAAFANIRVVGPNITRSRLKTDTYIRLVPQGPVPDLRQVHVSTKAAFAREGFRSAKAFHPHLTLRYGPWDMQGGAIAPIGWIARELVLICSHQGRSYHEVLARQPMIEQLRLF